MCNVLVDLLYDNVNSKQFVWDMCGDYIVDKLLKDNDRMINYPKLDNTGDIDWLGDKYKIVSVKMEDEKQC